MQKKITVLFDRLLQYKYAVFVLLAGILLMLVPLHREVQPPSVKEPEASVQEDTEVSLKAMLQNVEGAGRVEVLLTREQDFENLYQTDSRQKSQEAYTEAETNTVIISGSNGEDHPVLISSTYPLYRGAVVICDGADRPTVRLNIIRAVSSATGLSSDKISVIKMRQD